MGASPERPSTGLGTAREQPCQDVARLTDHTSPDGMVRRHTERVRGPLSGVQERVMAARSGPGRGRERGPEGARHGAAQPE